MGNVEKCNCFKGDDKQTYTIEERKNDSKVATTPSKSPFNANTFLSKSKAKTKTNDDFESKIKSLSKNDLLSITKLLAYCKGVLFRKHFTLTIKASLISEFNSLYNKCMEDFTTQTMLKAESYKDNCYNPNGWINHTNQKEDSRFKVNYGKVLETKLLISKDGSCIYSGSINYRQQKHGFGVLLNSNGEKFEGFWLNDKFSGWGKHIDAEGNILVGKCLILLSYLLFVGCSAILIAFTNFEYTFFLIN